ncbi:Protein CBG10287 [Caenorhabditis briggsae]|uniref:Protein CBG10287 n=1 Tax=Caenorhabditis briggsae TaxID=6238 RepID=A8XAP2_CAEBR|nr:Protein CBG10287 [Caenorhabditis briggsae]CAP29707.2 Protein CBG10287 [Caenorhabditis briggsae]
MASDDDVIYLSDDEENQREVERQKALDKKKVEEFQKNHPEDFERVREVFDTLLQYVHDDRRWILDLVVPRVPYHLGSVRLTFAHFRKEILDHLMPDAVMSLPSQMGWLHMTYNRQPEISTINFSHVFKACQIEEGDIKEYYAYRNGIDRRDGIKRHSGVLMNPIAYRVPKPTDTRNASTQWGFLIFKLHKAETLGYPNFNFREPEGEDQEDCQVVEPSGPKRGKIRPSQCQAPTEPDSLESWISRNQRGATPDIDGQGDDAESPARTFSRTLSQQDRHRMSGGAATSPVVPMSARRSRSDTGREKGSQRSTGPSLIDSATRPRSSSPPTAPSSPLAPCRQLTPSDAPATVQSSRSIQRNSRTGRFTRRVNIRTPLTPSDAIPRQCRGTQGSPAKPAIIQRASQRRSSSINAPSSPVFPRRCLRSADAPAMLQQGRRKRFTAPVAPRRSLTPSDAPRTTQQGRRSSRGNLGSSANSGTHRRRPSSASDAPQPSPSHPAQPSSSEASQKPKKASRKRPAPYKAFGCPRRRRSHNPAKRSTGAAGSSTTVASSDRRGQGKVAAAKAGPTTAAPSGRGRGTRAPQPKKRNTVI